MANTTTTGFFDRLALRDDPVGKTMSPEKAAERFLTKAEKELNKPKNQERLPKRLDEPNEGKIYHAPEGLASHFTEFSQHTAAAVTNRPLAATHLGTADAITNHEFAPNNKAANYAPLTNGWQRVRNLLLPHSLSSPKFNRQFSTLLDGHESKEVKNDFKEFNAPANQRSIQDGYFHVTSKDLKNASDPSNTILNDLDLNPNQLESVRSQKLEHSKLEHYLKLKKVASSIWKYSGLSKATKALWGSFKSVGAVQKKIIAHNFYQGTLGEGRTATYTKTKRAHKHTFASRFVGKSFSSALKVAATIVFCTTTQLLPTNILIGTSFGVALLGRIFFAYKYHEERNREELRTNNTGRPACSTLGETNARQDVIKYIEFRKEEQQIQHQVKKSKQCFSEMLKKHHVRINAAGEPISKIGQPLDKTLVKNIKDAYEILQGMQRLANYTKKIKGSKRWLKAELQCFAQLQAFSFGTNMVNCTTAIIALAGAGSATVGPIAAAGVILTALTFAAVLPRTYANFFEQMNINNLREGNTRKPLFSEHDIYEATQFSHGVDLNRQGYNFRLQREKGGEQTITSYGDYLKQHLITRTSEQNAFSIGNPDDDIKPKAALKEWEKYSRAPEIDDICYQMRLSFHQKIDVDVKELYQYNHRDHKGKPVNFSTRNLEKTHDLYTNIAINYLLKLENVKRGSVAVLAKHLNLEVPDLDDDVNYLNFIEQMAMRLSFLRYQAFNADAIQRVLGTDLKNLKKQMPEIAAIILNIDEFHTAICLQALQPPSDLLHLDFRELNAQHKADHQFSVQAGQLQSLDFILNIKEVAEKKLHAEVKRIRKLPFLKTKQRELIIENLVSDFYHQHRQLFNQYNKSRSSPTQQLNLGDIYGNTVSYLAHTLKEGQFKPEDQVKIIIKFCNKFAREAFDQNANLDESLNHLLEYIKGAIDLNDSVIALLKQKVKTHHAHYLKNTIERDLHQIKENNIANNPTQRRKLVVLEDLLSPDINPAIREKYQALVDNSGVTINQMYQDAIHKIEESRQNTAQAVDVYQGLIGDDLKRSALEDGDLMTHQTHDVSLSALYQSGILAHTNWAIDDHYSDTDSDSDDGVSLGLGNGLQNRISEDLGASYERALQQADDLHAQMHDIPSIKGTWQTQYQFRIRKAKDFLEYKFTHNLYQLSKETKKIAETIKKLDTADLNGANTIPTRQKLLQKGQDLINAFMQNQAQVQADLSLLIQKENIINDAVQKSETGVLVFSADQKATLNQQFENAALEASFYDENVAAELYNDVDKEIYGKVYEDLKGKFSASIPGTLFAAGISIGEANDWLGKQDGLPDSVHHNHLGILAATYAAAETPLLWVPIAGGFAAIFEKSTDSHKRAYKKFTTLEDIPAEQLSNVRVVNFMNALHDYTKSISENNTIQTGASIDTQAIGLTEMATAFQDLSQLFQDLRYNDDAKKWEQSERERIQKEKESPLQQRAEDVEKLARLATQPLQSTATSESEINDQQPKDQVLRQSLIKTIVHVEPPENFGSLEKYSKMQTLLGNNWFKNKFRMARELLIYGFILIKRGTWDQVKLTNELEKTRPERREADLEIARHKRQARRNYGDVYNSQIAHAIYEEV